MLPNPESSNLDKLTSAIGQAFRLGASAFAVVLGSVLALQALGYDLERLIAFM